MPLYSFICKKCNKYFEVIVPLADCESSLKCKYCKKEMQKVMDAPMFVVK